MEEELGQHLAKARLRRLKMSPDSEPAGGKSGDATEVPRETSGKPSILSK